MNSKLTIKRIFVISLGLSLVTYFSCTKEHNQVKLSNLSVNKLKPSFIETPSVIQSSNGPVYTESEAVTLAYYDYLENPNYGITRFVPDNKLKLLGDMVGRSSFDSASRMSGISISSLQQMRNKYYSGYSTYYYEVIAPQPPVALLSSAKKEKKEKGPIADYMMPGTCIDDYNICQENSTLNYLEGMGACYVGGLAAGAFLTPFVGVLGGIGCGLIQGRRYTLAKRSCSNSYANCK